MDKQFDSTLLICPKRYSLSRVFHKILEPICHEIKSVEANEALLKQDVKFNNQIFRFPHAVRKRWEKYFFNKINKYLIAQFNASQADLVLVYNSEFLLPETCEQIKKSAKLIFFLGDSPFYTPTNDYFLTCLSHADLILAPDSFWLQQLNTIGLANTLFYATGIDEEEYFLLEDNTLLESVPETEIFYTGKCYKNSWGYKKAMLMSQFTAFDFQLSGNDAWKRWFRFFPELQAHFSISGFIPTQQLNALYNRAKLVPVDGNPAILNGFHLRVFETLNAGALPLIEYRKDVNEKLFAGFQEQLPLIRDYRKANQLASYYLQHENERLQLTGAMREFINQKYTFDKNAARLLEALKK